jgi:hypothetical protein
MSGTENKIARAIRALQDAIQALGKPVQYIEAGATSGRTIRARVLYLSAAELANSVEQYPMRVTLDARDFPTRAPTKGDVIVIDDARRGVMSVAESHIGETLVQYRCGVAG